MRRTFTALLVVCLCQKAIAAPPEKIAPGISLTAAKEILQKHGFEIDARKYGLAMVAHDHKNKLEFCAIDDDITLVIAYSESREIIEALEIVVIPKKAPKQNRVQFSRNVLEIAVEDGGAYTLKLKRKAKLATSSK